MKMTVSPIVVGGLETVAKSLEKRLDILKIMGSIETVETRVW